MEVTIDNKNYKVNIIRKNNKNTYLRVNESLEINVTTNFLMPTYKIESFINDNIPSIKKMISTRAKKNEKLNSFYLLGNKYDIILCDSFKKPYIDENKVYCKDTASFDKFYKEYAREIFSERLKVNYNKFEERIPYPNLKIRKMKAKWGYCRKVDNTVMLNLELIKYGIDEIDYVIIHELCHLLEFNHSRAFWYYVSKYKPDYRKNKKVLKED